MLHLQHRQTRKIDKRTRFHLNWIPIFPNQLWQILYSNRNYHENLLNSIQRDQKIKSLKKKTFKETHTYVYNIDSENKRILDTLE